MLAIALVGAMLLPAHVFAQEKQRAAVQDGVKAYDDGDFAAARQKFLEAAESAALLTTPEQVLLHKYLAYCQVVLENPDKAKEEFRRALTLDPSLDLDPAVVPPKIVEVFRGVQEDMRPRNSNEALKLSLMAPGLGQFRTGHKAKGIAFAAGTVVFAAASVNYVLQANKAAGYVGKAGPADQKRFQQQSDEYALKRNVAIGATVAIWGGAALDAWLGARGGAPSSAKRANGARGGAPSSAKRAVTLVPDVSPDGGSLTLVGRF